MARIGLILEMFPDAKFVFIYRDPYKTVESFYRFFHEVLPAVELQVTGDRLSRDILTRVYVDMIRQYFLEKTKILPENLLEIRYEEFKKNPVETLKLIFSQFNIPGFEEAAPNFEKYMDSTSAYKQHRYDVCDETISLVNKYAGDIVDLLDYPKRT